MTKKEELEKKKQGIKDMRKSMDPQERKFFDQMLISVLKDIKKKG